MCTNGTVTCWGIGQFSQDSAPTEPFQPISAGEFHTCGVRAYGILACWGKHDTESADSGLAAPPSGQFQSVSSGGSHLCGVHTNGALVCRGLNDFVNALVWPSVIARPDAISPTWSKSWVSPNLAIILQFRGDETGNPLVLWYRLPVHKLNTSSGWEAVHEEEPSLVFVTNTIVGTRAVYAAATNIKEIETVSILPR